LRSKKKLFFMYARPAMHVGTRRVPGIFLFSLHFPFAFIGGWILAFGRWRSKSVEYTQLCFEIFAFPFVPSARTSSLGLQKGG